MWLGSDDVCKSTKKKKIEMWAVFQGLACHVTQWLSHIATLEKRTRLFLVLFYIQIFMEKSLSSTHLFVCVRTPLVKLSIIIHVFTFQALWLFLSFSCIYIRIFYSTTWLYKRCMHKAFGHLCLKVNWGPRTDPISQINAELGFCSTWGESVWASVCSKQVENKKEQWMSVL